MSLTARYEWGDQAVQILTEASHDIKSAMKMVNKAITGKPMTEKECDMYIEVVGQIGFIPSQPQNLYSWWREKYAETGQQEYLEKMLKYVEP